MDMDMDMGHVWHVDNKCTILLPIPSSSSPTSTTATPYAQWIEKSIDAGLVIRTNVMFTVGIRSNLAEEGSEAN